MGLINLFSRKNQKVKRGLSTQPGAWCVISEGGKKCLFLHVYKSSDRNREGNPPQMLVFEPHHIEEFDKLLDEWKEAAKHKPPEESGNSGLVKPQAARAVKESGDDSSAMRQIADALGLATKEDIAQLKKRLDELLAKQGGR